MRRPLAALAALAALALAGCRVDDTHYVFPDGGGDDTDAAVDAEDIDAPPPGPAIVVTPSTMLQVREGDSTSVAVRLSEAPAGPVTLNISAGPMSGLSFDPPSWTFTPEAWSDQPIFISGLEDLDANDGQKTVVFSATGYAAVSVPISITDNDDLGLFVSPTSIDVTEGGTGTVQVNLTAQPSGLTTVTLSSSMAGIATVSPASLMFTTTDWGTLQTVTITGVQDPDVLPGAAVITVEAASLSPVEVAVDVTDDDILAIVPSPTSLSGTEGASITGFTVGLTELPPVGFTVTITSSDPAVAVVPSVLSFSSMTPQGVMITVGQDPDYANDSVTLTLHANEPTVLDRTVAIAVTDNDLQAIVVNPTGLSAVERGADVPLDVHLAFAPPTAVTVDVTTAGAIGVDPVQLTFTPADYLTNQRIMVTPLSDNDLATSTATVQLSTTDAPDRDVMVTITDADQQTILAAPTSVNVNEGGTNTFAVSLGYMPSGSVTVTAAPGNLRLGVAPTMLTFDGTTWATPRTVTLTGGADADSMDLNTSVTLSGAGAPSPTIVLVKIVDTTATGLEVNPNPLNLTEGPTTPGTLIATLTMSPTVAVTGTVMSSDTSIATISPTGFTLDSGNWNTGVSFTVTGVEDPDITSDVATMTFTAGALSKSVTVNVADNDLLRVVLSTNTLAVPEAQSGPVDVTLSAAPLAQLTVTITGTAAATVVPTSLTFRPDNFSLPQQVMVTSVRDDDVDLGSTSVSFNPSPGGLSATLTVNQMTDATILAGYPSTVLGTGNRVYTSLQSWFAPSIGEGGASAGIPTCLHVDKLVVINKSPTGGIVHGGLYASVGSATPPTGLITDSGAKTTYQVGANTFDLGGAFACSPTSTAFLALKTFPGSLPGPPMLGAFNAASSVAHCTAMNASPGPLPGSWAGAGSGSCSPDNQPVAAWFVMHPSEATCVCE